MTQRHITTAVTMLVLVGILALGVFVGVKELFAPIPGEADDAATATADPSCDQVRRGQRLLSRQVTVNVFNGGTRSGLAGQTLDTLASRGFRPGEAGNAPADNGVRRVQVWIVAGEKAAGRLVAGNFGPRVPVRRIAAARDLGDGVDVVVGNGLGALAPPIRSIRVRSDQQVCRSRDDADSASS